MSYTENVVTGDKYRVNIVADEDGHKPEGDCMAPTLQLDGYNATIMYGDDSFADVFNHFAEHTMNPVDAFERYVRIFHGATSVESYNVGNRREYAYVTFDTAEWRERVGAPEESKDLLTEVRAWADGDVWGVVVEKRVTWSTDEELDDMDTWEEVEAVWGYYGHEWAEQEAREQYEAFAK